MEKFMNTIKNPRSLIVVALTVVVIGFFQLQPARAQKEGDSVATGGPHYTVVATEGHNLIVTDNQKNELYFYTIDQDKDIGSDLKLRGHIDLNHVGKPVIKPFTHKAESSSGH
jgi:hypothetical protein